MALNQEPGTLDVKDPTTGNYDSLPPQVDGDRDLWSLIDEADAAAFLIPAAALENAAGKYVKPTSAAMAAAVNDMTVRPGRHPPVNYTEQGPGRLPADHGHLRDRAHRRDLQGQGGRDRPVPRLRGRTSGQMTGHRPGQLPLGLPAAAAALRAADAQGRHRGARPGGQPRKPKASPSASASASASPPNRRRPSPSPSPSSSVAPRRTRSSSSFSRPDTHRDVLAGARAAHRRRRPAHRRPGRAGARQPRGARRGGGAGCRRIRRAGAHQEHIPRRKKP